MVEINQSEVEGWLKPILAKLQLKNYSLQVQGTSEKGDGYMGDILFVQVTGKTLNDEDRKYDWVLKCGKRSQKLRQQAPLRELFENEIAMYDRVFPEMIRFQKSKNVRDYFASFPKCFGTVLLDDMEVIVLENLKKLGYDLWDRMKPMPTDHLKLILRQYGKLHAISVALQDQQPLKFRELAESIRNIFGMFFDAGISTEVYTKSISQSYELIKEHVDREVSEKWLKLIDFIPIFGKKEYGGYDSALKVIGHGDCWNNNFLFKVNEDDGTCSTDVAILDWQMTDVSTPIFDLSYFLFTCISEADLRNIDALLDVYHESFRTHLTSLGSEPKSYPLETFKGDWKRFCIFGIMNASILLRIALSEGDDIVDIAADVENGLKFGENFGERGSNKNDAQVLERLLPIVRYAVEQEII